MTPDEKELAARRAAVAAMASVCPNCGRSLAGHGGTYAQDEPKDVSADRGPVPTLPTKQNESWRDRPPLL